MCLYCIQTYQRIMRVFGDRDYNCQEIVGLLEFCDLQTWRRMHGFGKLSSFLTGFRIQLLRCILFTAVFCNVDIVYLSICWCVYFLRYKNISLRSVLVMMVSQMSYTSYNMFLWLPGAHMVMNCYVCE